MDLEIFQSILNARILVKFDGNMLYIEHSQQQFDKFHYILLIANIATSIYKFKLFMKNELVC